MPPTAVPLLKLPPAATDKSKILRQLIEALLEAYPEGTTLSGDAPYSNKNLARDRPERGGEVLEQLGPTRKPHPKKTRRKPIEAPFFIQFQNSATDA